MNYKKFTAFGLIIIGMLLAGCGECVEMTDGGPIQHGWERFKDNDRRESAHLMPQLRRWWASEKSKWPVFVNNCKDAEKCYDEADADNGNGNGMK